MLKRIGFCIAWLGCGGTPAPGDGSPDDSVGSICDEQCVSKSWWLGRSSNCTVLCMSDPSLDECMQSDCEVVEGRKYAGSSQHSLGLLHSAAIRSFYSFIPPNVESYEIREGCNLVVGGGSPRAFTCDATAGELDFTTATFLAATPAQEVALEMALASGTSAHYLY